MDFNPPSTADFASSDAQAALQGNKALAQRVHQLELQVEQIFMALAKIQQWANDWSQGMNK